MRFYIDAILLFLVVYGLCYKEVAPKKKYKIFFPKKIMNIIYFPAMIISRIPLLRNILVDSRVQEMSMLNGFFCIYMIYSLPVGYIFHTVKRTEGLFTVSLFLMGYLFTLTKSLYRIMDLYKDPKKGPLKVFIFGVWLIVSGFSLIFVLAYESVYPQYNKVSRVLIFVVFTVIMLVSEFTFHRGDVRKVSEEKEVTEESATKKTMKGKRESKIRIMIITVLIVLLFIEGFADLGDVTNNLEKKEPEVEIRIQQTR